MWAMSRTLDVEVGPGAISPAALADIDHPREGEFYLPTPAGDRIPVKRRMDRGDSRTRRRRAATMGASAQQVAGVWVLSRHSELCGKATCSAACTSGEARWRRRLRG